MTIGTPLWDDFVKNLKKVKQTVEDIGFMPKDVPSEYELKSMSVAERIMTKKKFHGYYSVNSEKNILLYQQYRALADQEPNFILGCHLAEYKYYDMVPIVENPLSYNLATNLKCQKKKSPVSR